MKFRVWVLLCSLCFTSSASAGLVDLRHGLVSFWKNQFVADKGLRLDEYQENLLLTLMMVDLRLRSQMGHKIIGSTEEFFSFSNTTYGRPFHFVGDALDMNLERYRGNLVPLLEMASQRFEAKHSLRAADLFWEVAFRNLDPERAAKAREFQLIRLFSDQYTDEDIEIFREIFGEMLGLITYDFAIDAERVKIEVGIRSGSCENMLKGYYALPNNSKSGQ